MSRKTESQSSTEDLSYFEEAVRRGWIKPTTQARSKQMCEKILAAAYEVFSEHGYQETKVSDITKRAGCSVGIFYKRFPDKESLFYALQYRHYERAHRQLDRLKDVQESKMTTERVILGFVQSTVEFMVANAGFNRAQVELSLKDDRVLEERRDNDRYAADRLMDFLVSRGELRDTPVTRDHIQFAVRAVLAAITHLVLFGPGPYAVTDRQVIDNLTQILLGFLHEEQRRPAGRKSRRAPSRGKKNRPPKG